MKTIPLPSRVLATCVLPLCFACASGERDAPAAGEAASTVASDTRDTPDAPRDVRRVCEPITELLPGPDGITYVHFERSSLRYCIDPAESPDADAMLARARAALASGEEVCALVDRATIPRDKTRPVANARPPLIVGFE